MRDRGYDDSLPAGGYIQYLKAKVRNPWEINLLQVLSESLLTFVLFLFFIVRIAVLPYFPTPQ